MDRWDEMRTAYHVARLGTVSAAADALGIHRATINRHIDTLEQALGGKLFQRHARGYTMTEAGRDLLQVASATEDQFAQLAGRTRGRTTTVSGELIVTSVEVMSDLVLPALNRFRRLYPETSVRYLVSAQVMKLDYGEAHVAIRGGRKPDHPDNVVQPYLALRTGLYAHRDYVARRGLLTDPPDFDRHDFIGSGDAATRVPFRRWMLRTIPPERLVFITSDLRIERQAVLTGLGIGFLPEAIAQAHPEMVEMMAPKPAWDSLFWLVTHVDLHRTAKIQAVLDVLKSGRDAAAP